jgi:AmmeMemoRadiSam system protein A
MRLAARLLADFEPEALVLMSPHAPLVRGAFTIDTSSRLAGDLGQFGAPSVRVRPPGDPELAERIIVEAERVDVPVVPRDTSPLLDPGVLDHAALVPLSFLDREGRYPLVELSLAFLSFGQHIALGRAVRRAAEALGRRIAFVASGDCSHRLTHDAPAGFSPRGSEFDRQLVSLIAAGDFSALASLDPLLIEEAGECGLRSFITLGGFIEGTDAQPRVLAYEGPWGVGYLTAVVASPELLERLETPESGLKRGTAGEPESEPVALARHAIETYVREGRVVEPPPAEGLLARRAGAFVSLHRKGELRGCIGTIGPSRETLAEEIVHNAIQAATSDPRFPPLSADELADLEISVDVLHEPEPAAFEDLDPRTYGVIVTSGRRRGLLLPDLEGVDSAEQQVLIAMRKAGIEPGEPVSLERFRVDRYH